MASRAPHPCLALVLVLTGPAGCKFGGPASAAPEPDGAAPEWPLDGPPPGLASGDAATADADGYQPEAATTEASGPPPEAGAAACDPVRNTGCPPLLRCDLGEQPGESVCLGIWIAGEGLLCWRTANTDSCAPQLTCLEGRCQRLCRDDRDCTSPERRCCSGAIEQGGQSSGWRSCAACP
jgi:hypothetical protein